MSQESLLGAVNTGKTAHYVLQHLGPDLERQKEVILGKMKAMFRDGTWSEVKLLASVAELCTLEDIENRLKARITRGQNASSELNNAP